MKFRVPNTIIDEDGSAWFIQSVEYGKLQEITFMDDWRPNHFQGRPYLVCWRFSRKIDPNSLNEKKYIEYKEYANFEFNELYYKKGLCNKMEIRKIIF